MWFYHTGSIRNLWERLDGNVEMRVREQKEKKKKRKKEE
jgi:hypothetical protein